MVDIGEEKMNFWEKKDTNLKKTIYIHTYIYYERDKERGERERDKDREREFVV